MLQCERVSLLSLVLVCVHACKSALVRACVRE